MNESSQVSRRRFVAQAGLAAAAAPYIVSARALGREDRHQAFEGLERQALLVDLLARLGQPPSVYKGFAVLLQRTTNGDFDLVHFCPLCAFTSAMKSAISCSTVVKL